MPSRTIRSFSDPDEFSDALRQWYGTEIVVTPKERGNYTAKVISINLHRLWLQRMSENLARTYYIEPGGNDRTFLGFQTEAGPIQAYRGLELRMRDILSVRSGTSYHANSSGAVGLSSMSLAERDIMVYGEAILGRALTPATDLVLETPAHDALAKLHRLHSSVIILAEDAPSVLAHPEAARALEQALIEAMIDCLGGGKVEAGSTAQRRHTAIMRRFDSVIEEHFDEPLYIPELCREVGASVRTLNTCCQEHLGMGPKHYLLLRRMRLVRRALRQSALPDTTVTEVATRYGFWQLGRFAVEYKTLFGESPSDTLAHVE
jgi:AraC-like DNA-binding protein